MICKTILSGLPKIMVYRLIPHFKDTPNLKLKKFSKFRLAFVCSDNWRHRRQPLLFCLHRQKSCENEMKFMFNISMWVIICISIVRQSSYSRWLLLLQERNFAAATEVSLTCSHWTKYWPFLETKISKPLIFSLNAFSNGKSPNKGKEAVAYQRHVEPKSIPILRCTR